MSVPGSLLHFLSALGNSILNSFWQMGLLWLFVVIVSKYRKNLAPGALSTLSFTALLTGFIAFIITFITSFFSPVTGSGILYWVDSSRLSETIMNYAACIYLLLLIVPIAKFFAGYISVHKLRRKGLHRAHGKYKIFMLDMVNYLGIKKNVKLWLSDVAEVPVTIGFLKPIILLPVAVINHLSPTQVEAIILHELAHIKKNDYLINFVNQLMITVLYFNPFAKALLKLYDVEREKTADDYVLRFEYNNQMYASTLLQLARQTISKQERFTVQLSGKSQLYHRVQWIMGLQKRPAIAFKKLAVAIMMIVFFLFLLSGAKNSVRTGTKFTGMIADNISVKPKFISEVAKSGDNLKIKEISSLENKTTDHSNNTVYLKQIENTETGNIEITIPSEIIEQPVYIFASHPEKLLPPLTKEQEQNVQQTVTAAKKVFAETSWQQIEASLAETVVSDQKVYLKEAFKLMVDAADWSGQANLLRIQYDMIDWDKARENFNIAIAYIKLDSVYNQYTTALEKYMDFKKDIGELKSEALAAKIAETEKILKKADSIRRKRVIEL